MTTVQPKPRAGRNRFSLADLRPLMGNDRVDWDNALPGFGLRCFRNGRQTWIVFTRIKGVVTKISLGSPTVVTETAARAAAQLLILEAKVRRDPLALRRAAMAAPLFANFAKDYRRYGLTRWKPSTLRSYDHYMRNHLMPNFGRKFLDQIDEPAVLEWFAATSRTRSGAANRILAILRSMFNKADEWGMIPAYSNPCAGIRCNRQRVFRRYLTEAELLRLGSALEELQMSDPIRVGVVRMLLYTGCRKDEILSLRWADVTGRVMVLRDSKTGPRGVELGAAAQAALALVPITPRNPWVFANLAAPGERLKDILAYWHKTVLPTAKIKPLRLHDLRHTFASHAAIMQENTPTIAKLLGHSGTDNTQRYMHLADQPALDAAERISEVLWGALI